MSTTNPNYGLQLDANTLALYKSISEIGESPADGQTMVDSAGNYDFIAATGTANYNPPVVNGPLGKIGALDQKQFARSWRRPNGSGTPTMARVQTSADIDQAFNDAIRDAGGFMQQVMLYADEELNFAADMPIMGGQVSPTSTSTDQDRLAHIYFEQNGTLTTHFESANTDTFLTTASVVAVPGKWQVITVVWLPNGGGYNVDVYAHTLDGTVTGGFVEGWSAQGTLPIAGSGLGAPYGIGYITSGTATLPFNGAIAFARILKGVGSMDASAIASEATELLNTGELASVATTNDLLRIEFNDVPLWIDEGPLGLHAGWSTDLADPMLVDWTDGGGDKYSDIVGSGGRSRQQGAGGRAVVPETCKPNEFLAATGKSNLQSFFNGTGNPNGVSTYTMQYIGKWMNGPNLSYIGEWRPTGQNALFRFSLDTVNGGPAWFSEYSFSRTDVVLSNEVFWGPISDEVLTQTMLYTLRVGPKDGSPTVQQIKLSINDNIDVYTADLNFPPDNGGRAYGIYLGWADYGLLQEFKISDAVITDQQILDDWARIGARVGPVGTPAEYRMRGYDTTLTSLVYWTATAEDPTGAQYTGPGPLIDVVTMGVPTS